MRGFGIIGGGAVLFTTSALAAQTVLPLLGETFLIISATVLFLVFYNECSGIGTAASIFGGGAVVTRAMCTAPFCR